MFQVGMGVYKIDQKDGLAIEHSGQLSNVTALMVLPMTGQGMTGKYAP